LNELQLFAMICRRWSCVPNQGLHPSKAAKNVRPSIVKWDGLL